MTWAILKTVSITLGFSIMLGNETAVAERYLPLVGMKCGRIKNVNEHEFREQIMGKPLYFLSVPALARVEARSEMFHEDGQYTLAGGRQVVEGRYSIQGNRIKLIIYGNTSHTESIRDVIICDGVYAFKFTGAKSRTISPFTVSK